MTSTVGQHLIHLRATFSILQQRMLDDVILLANWFNWWPIIWLITNMSKVIHLDDRVIHLNFLIYLYHSNERQSIDLEPKNRDWNTTSWSYQERDYHSKRQKMSWFDWSTDRRQRIPKSANNKKWCHLSFWMLPFIPPATVDLKSSLTPLTSDTYTKVYK